MGEEKPRVLVVEDEPELADIFSIWLSEGFSVETATRGARAIELLEQDFAVVVLDWRIPDVSGAEVLDAIRAEGPHVPVAVITGADPEFLGVDDEVELILRKPVRSDELVDAVDELASDA